MNRMKGKQYYKVSLNIFQFNLFTVCLYYKGNLLRLNTDIPVCCLQIKFTRIRTESGSQLAQVLVQYEYTCA